MFVQHKAQSALAEQSTYRYVCRRYAYLAVCISSLYDDWVHMIQKEAALTLLILCSVVFSIPLTSSSSAVRLFILCNSLGTTAFAMVVLRMMKLHTVVDTGTLIRLDYEAAKTGSDSKPYLSKTVSAARSSAVS
jgi:hypothetical protein